MFLLFLTNPLNFYYKTLVQHYKFHTSFKMEWQDQDPEISVEDVFEITLNVNPESTFEGDLEYVEDSEGEDYPIFPPPAQELLQQQPTLHSR